MPVCAAMSFFRSPTVSVGRHLTRTVDLAKLDCGRADDHQEELYGSVTRVLFSHSPLPPIREFAMTSMNLGGLEYQHPCSCFLLPYEEQQHNNPPSTTGGRS